MHLEIKAALTFLKYMSQNRYCANFNWWGYGGGDKITPTCRQQNGLIWRAFLRVRHAGRTARPRSFLRLSDSAYRTSHKGSGSGRTLPRAETIPWAADVILRSQADMADTRYDVFRIDTRLLGAGAAGTLMNTAKGNWFTACYNERRKPTGRVQRPLSAPGLAAPHTSSATTPCSQCESASGSDGDPCSRILITSS